MVTSPNFIPDLNPFMLATPPTWWLDKLREFDPSLIVMPSRQANVYRLCQRRPMSLTMKMVNEILKEQGDTKAMLEHGLIPVTTIRANANWDNPLMWVDLAERAPWRQGGAQAVIDKIEGREQAAQEIKDAKIDEQLESQAREGWNYYNMKRGLRTRMWSPRTRNRTSQQQLSPTIKIKKEKPTYLG